MDTRLRQALADHVIMLGSKPFTFPSIPGPLNASTEIYTQRWDSSLPPDEYKFTVAEIVAYLAALGLLLTAIPGPYDSDADAAAGGVAIGGYYEISISNIYGIPAGNGGVLKRRVE